LRKAENKGLPFLGRLKNGVFPVIVGTALFLTYPSLTSYQDIASLTKVEAGENLEQRWLASLSQAPGLSTFFAGNNAQTPTLSAKFEI